jgi:periplasmic protein TonB
MAYADQQGMSTNRMIAIVLVVLLHAGLGFALVSGLAYEAIKKAKEKMEVIDVEEEKPPEEEPPPPPPEEAIISPPPTFAKESPIKNDNPMRTTDDPTPKDPDPQPQTKPCNGAMIPIGATCVTEDPDPIMQCPNNPNQRERRSELSKCKAPVQEVDKSKKATPKNNPGSWANTNDYPQRALNQGREGTTGFSVTVTPEGRVGSCSVTSSSGHGDLDSTTCSKVTSRARFNPAHDKAGNPTTGSYSSRVTWKIPKE